MPLGPLQLTDETSLDLGAKIARATKAAMGDAYDDGADDVIFTMVEQGRLGRKSKAGFYAYDEAGKRLGLWAGLSDLAPVAETQPDLTEVQHRLLFAQVLEAVRALEEGVLTDIREGDVGAILGWGFAPWSGGPFSWLDMLGAAYAAERCDALRPHMATASPAPRSCGKWPRRVRPSTAASAPAWTRRRLEAAP
jgi:3-hydroxyacyl-CoA dehydrogenase/enoyl-CoA hydratase/3-hydroxybutyryl-CoA epimerase